ncbi:MAG: efflux transporter periplasmic adaptor subunit, partial [Burkholderiaceae bacterium]
ILKPAMLVRLKPSTNSNDVLFGQIVRVEPVAQTKVSTLGVEEQRVNVVVEFSTDALPIVLGDGYRIEAAIVTMSERDVLLVPIGALVRDDQGWHVYVVENNEAQLRRVDVAARNQSRVWIISGLEVGDKVIVYPPETLAQGSRVTFTQASTD